MRIPFNLMQKSPAHIKSVVMESEICKTFSRNSRDNATRANCDIIRSASHIQLTALRGEMERAGTKCNMMKKRLEYFQILYQSAGPTSIDIPVKTSHASPKSSRIEILRSPMIDEIDANESKENEQMEEKSPHFPKPQKQKSTVILEIKKSSVHLITNAWSEKSIGEIHQAPISNDQFFDPSDREIIETLPREPEIVLKLTDRREVSARDKIARPRDFTGRKPESSRRDETPPKIIKKKRKKMKLKRSNSKSTTASKHVANLSETTYRRVKRRFYKVEESPPVLDNSNEKPQPPLKKLMSTETGKEQEVVEIYHNAAVHHIQSNSEASLKHQQTNSQEKSFKDTPKNIKNRINETRTSEMQTRSNQMTKNREEKIPLVTNPEPIPRKGEPEIRLKEPPEEFPPPARTWPSDAYDQPNYQQPTFASKLKCVNRCYLTARFNLRNIPFVVGTSITPSHNLGLNIQQVLSLMKSKQPGLATEMRPFFMKKVGKELHPCDLVEDVRDSSAEIFGKSDKNSLDVKQDSVVQRKTEELKHVESRLRLYPGMTSNSSEIRNVFIRLHYKFEETQTKYDKVQEKLDKSKDEAHLKELRELEEELVEELNAQESEIKAVVGLYNEVMALKSQIYGASHQKNSLLCIGESSKVPLRLFPVYQRLRTSSCRIKRPSTSTRLTGLLRQIQSFQQQLISS
uniref:Cep57 protein n=1 Tax=Fopius arisanus TaxID=64838 RepID=A0A0C9QMX4_9HYME